MRREDQNLRPESLHVLLLTQQHTEYLWLSQMLAQDAGIQWRISWSNSVAVCVDCLQKHRFDVILWDCHFRKEDSLSFLRFISTQSQQAPVIALSSEASTLFARSVLQAGAQDYLVKRNLFPGAVAQALSHAVFRQRVQLQRLRAYADPSIGSVDRNLFYDRLQQSLLRAERRQERVGLLFVNIDDFKRINNGLGYRAGDSLIRLVATRLRGLLRRSDSLARIGGDEFAVILEKPEQDFSLIQVAKKIQDAFAEPFELSRQQISLTLSMGLAVYPDGGKTSDLLLRNANQAMFEAKSEHGNSYRFYNQQMNEEINRQLLLEADFRQALRGNQLALFYQPKIDVASNRITGMEALVRWQHPRLGLLGPGQFISIAEKTGLIIPMGYWVIQRACEDLRKLHRLGHADLVCAVNLSFRQFFDKKLSETLFRIIYNANIDTGSLEFELTESAMMFDREHTQRCLSELHQLGISFALDDFGTGYSSFSHLQKFPISTLKIDKSFVENITSSQDDATLVRGIISLAHSLNMAVVAEGVETPEQLAFLRYHHCDQVQGYLFSAAVPLEEFCKLLEKQHYSTGLKWS